MKSRKFVLWTAPIATAIALAPAGALGGGNTPITAGTTIVMRAVNFDPNGLPPPSPAKRIGDGNNPKVDPSEDVDNLSVNCSDDKTVTESVLRSSLPAGTHIYSGTLETLRNSRKGVTLVRDPVPGNDYHCLLSNVTPKQFISGTSWKQ
ncbi:hypothetical protein EH240_28580 [Mesorhizobium tamadayense]|uniref:Secreted protein n=1 Tax=Mesorhizobium tamadayense TaxID=425306 RepID=A0A3P3F5Q9_9HYPH|nr:hypothetical protein [Mesorhizobium tamadayense]RRH93905.1 hypothetical protein EH240_28580 [Mesorhizobium tamadayense]